MEMEVVFAETILAVAAGVAYFRGQNGTSILSWVAPATLAVAAAYVVGAPVGIALPIGAFMWAFMFSTSERIGQWWWRHVLGRRVSTGMLPAPDNYVSRQLEAALAPAWHEHRKYLDGRSSANRIASRYATARDRVRAIEPPDSEWARVLTVAQDYLDLMLTHLEGVGPDFDVVHDRHDMFRRRWRELEDARRRPWGTFQLF